MLPAWYHSLSVIEKIQFWSGISAAGSGMVLAITLVCLIWYSWETRSLRLAAQRQIETSYMPILALSFGGAYSKSRDAYGAGGFPSITLTNVGFGPAFNIGISTWKNRDCEISFSTVRILSLSDKPLNLEHTMYVDGKKVEAGYIGFALFVSKDTDSQNQPLIVPVNIIFDDATGKKYVSSYEIKFIRGENQEVQTLYRGMKQE